MCIANPQCPAQRVPRVPAVNKIVGDGSEWLDRRLAIEPNGDLDIVASSYPR